jgi:hypothetical protein
MKLRAAFSGFGLGRTPNMIGSLANKSLERTVNHRGRIVLAIDCVLADAQCRWWWAAQLGR